MYLQNEVNRNPIVFNINKAIEDLNPPSRSNYGNSNVPRNSSLAHNDSVNNSISARTIYEEGKRNVSPQDRDIKLPPLVKKTNKNRQSSQLTGRTFINNNNDSYHSNIIHFTKIQNIDQSEGRTHMVHNYI